MRERTRGQISRRISPALMAGTWSYASVSCPVSTRIFTGLVFNMRYVRLAVKPSLPKSAFRCDDALIRTDLGNR
jgi:hypothetical protein